jgi:hypothetical protein
MEFHYTHWYGDTSYKKSGRRNASYTGKKHRISGKYLLGGATDVWNTYKVWIFSMTRVWSCWLLWISLRAFRESWSKYTLEGRKGSVNLWSNNKKLLVVSDGLLNYGAYRLSKLPEFPPYPPRCPSDCLPRRSCRLGIHTVIVCR